MTRTSKSHNVNTRLFEEMTVEYSILIKSEKEFILGNCRNQSKDDSEHSDEVTDDESDLQIKSLRK